MRDPSDTTITTRRCGATLRNVPRSSLFALLFIPLCACSNVLGLDDLQFEEPPALNLSTSVGGHAAQNGGGGALGTGGDIIFSSGGHAPEEFPAVWPQNVVITSMVDGDENSAYWFYDPREERLHSLRYDLSGPDQKGESPWPGAWTHLLAFERSGEDVVMGYDADLGFVAEVQSQNASSDLLFLASDVGTAGRDLVLAVPLSGEIFTLAYTAESGSYRLFSTDNESEVSLCNGELAPGWTHAVAFTLSGVDGVLLMNEGSGELLFNSLLPCGEGSMSDIVLGYTTAPRIVFSFPGEGSDQLFLYFSDGEILHYEVALNEDGIVQAALVDSGLFRANLTDIAPLRAEGEPAALTYDAHTGVAQIRSLVAPIKVPVVIK